jgi:hypothetical protein
MRWEELGADGGGDDGVRREDAVQPTEDDRLHTVAAALVTLWCYLDSHGRWVGQSAFARGSLEQPRQWRGALWTGRSLGGPSCPEPPRAPKEAPMTGLGTAELAF